jgi:hypothetical protein
MELPPFRSPSPISPTRDRIIRGCDHQHPLKMPCRCQLPRVIRIVSHTPAALLKLLPQKIRLKSQILRIHRDGISLTQCLTGSAPHSLSCHRSQRSCRCCSPFFDCTARSKALRPQMIQSVQFSRHESAAVDWMPVSAKMSQQLDAGTPPPATATPALHDCNTAATPDSRHLTSEECASLQATTTSPLCWPDILLFFHSKQIPVFLPIPG